MWLMLFCRFPVGRKTVSKCFTALVLAFTEVIFFMKVLIETNVNISNELYFSDFFISVNYIG